MHIEEIEYKQIHVVWRISLGNLQI